MYLSRCDGTAVQQCQQTAKGCSANSSSSSTSLPHEVRKQNVTQELLRHILEMSAQTETNNFKSISKNRSTEMHVFFFQVLKVILKKTE